MFSLYKGKVAGKMQARKKNKKEQGRKSGR
jgi:hypothetical protein